ncbi:P2Y purinoceptor 11 [Bombina bombina]|uniref:P2Y purinoceptor 11 n=1 Tax=Bombina bombina TaxID=8345 RepID=UPI00235A651D|nr:P2Y purinoceptor 11 [Bombina bombina]
MASQNCSINFSHVQTTYLAPVYGVEFVLAVLGNSFAIWLLKPGRGKERHAGMIFSLNLAVSDLSYALTLPFLTAYYAVGKNWIFGLAFCKVERFLFNSNLYGSIFFITCISANRCLGVMFPFYARGKVEAKHAKFVSLAVWLVVITICSPVFAFSTLEVKKNTECIGTAVDEKLSLYIPYSLFLAGFGCGIPFIITLLSYIGIAHAVCKSHGLESREKRKVITMVCVVISLYSISFLPYHILRNLNLQNRVIKGNCNWSSYVHSAFQLTKALVALNPCIHPLLYTAVMDNVRSKFACCQKITDFKEEESIRL